MQIYIHITIYKIISVLSFDLQNNAMVETEHLLQYYLL